jgi:preprotein translocase subunit SecG
MLYRFLLIILILDSALLVTVILLQAGKGSGLAANFGGASSSPDAFIGVRQAGNILTKATWWCAGIFLGLSFVLQVMSTRAVAPKSVLEKTFSNAPLPAAPAPTNAAPAIPLEPTTGGAATTPTGGTANPVTGGATAPKTGGGAIPLTAPPPAPPAKR